VANGNLNVANDFASKHLKNVDVLGKLSRKLFAGHIKVLGGPDVEAWVESKSLG